MALRPVGTGTTLRTRPQVTGPAHSTDGDAVKLDKQELVRLLRTEGDNDTADKVEGSLPDEIDTDQHGDQLESVGLDRTQLMSKLAAGGFGGSIAP